MQLRHNPIIIGVSGKSAQTLSVRSMCRQLQAVGAQVMLLSHCGRNTAHIDAEAIDGLVLMGNDHDIDPARYLHHYDGDDPKGVHHPHTKSETRHHKGRIRGRYEDTILEYALERGMPVLGICGGMQRINVMLGGTLHQHLPDMVGSHKHMQQRQGIAMHIPTMPILIKEYTDLHRILYKAGISCVKTSMPNCPQIIMDNSMHHQAIDKVGKGLRVNALTDSITLGKGVASFVTMGIESDPAGSLAGQTIIGVQWHPEFGASSAGERICQHLVHAARKFRR